MGREPERTGIPSLAGLLGSTWGAARARLGPPDVERRAGGDRWVVYRRDGGTLRIRCKAEKPGTGGREEEGEERVASWTVRFARGPASLREAAEPLGLWPACAPDAAAGGARTLLRRPLPDPSGHVHSLTATLDGGLVRSLAGFDEPPEWLPGHGG